MRTNDTLPVFNISSRESSHLDFEEQGLAARACADISTGLGGAIAGAASGAIAGLMLKATQLLSATMGYDTQDFNLKDLVVCSTIDTAIISSGIGMLAGLCAPMPRNS